MVTLQDEVEDEEAWPQAKARSPLMRAEYAWLSAARRGEQTKHGAHVVVGCQSGVVNQGVGAACVTRSTQEALGGALQAAICRHRQRLPASHCLKMRQNFCDLSEVVHCAERAYSESPLHPPPRDTLAFGGADDSWQMEPPPGQGFSAAVTSFAASWNGSPADHPVYGV